MTVYPPDERFRVPDTAVYPYRAVGYLRVQWPGGTYQDCTGFLISPSVIATAGHCVYCDTKGAWPFTIAFQAGRNAGNSPYENCCGTTANTVAGWRYDLNERYDYGAVQLNCDVGNTVGWYGFSWTSESLAGQFRGQSGSPQYASGCGTYCAVSILARGQGAHHPSTNAATRISQAAFDHLVTWSPDHPG